MISWEIKNKVVNKLFYKGYNIIYPWGVETADSSAFFSLENGFGYRYKVISEKYEIRNNVYSANLKVKMKEGLWSLNITDSIIDGTTVINRKASLICLEDSYFMDFVLRFRVKKEYVKSANINGEEFYHKNTNIYYQYPVEEVVLIGEKGFDIRISIIDKKVPDKMKPYMYVRDLNDEWIIHVRMLPNEYDKEVIKLCNNWYKTKPIPQFLSKLILLNNKIKRNLWYRGEFSPFKSKILRFVNPAAFPMVKLLKGTILMWDVDFQIIDKNKNNK